MEIHVTVSIIAATDDQGGYGGLHGLGGDPDPRLHQVLLLRHAQPPGPVPQAREADPGGEGPLRVQVSSSKFRILKGQKEQYFE